MGKVIFDISMSLDGFITGANRTPEEPLGDEGEHLHDWAFNSKNAYNRSLISQSVNTTGAVICGRRTYDDSLPFWGADGPTGAARLPVFVVTHHLPKEVPGKGVYTIVTDGIKSALQQAKKAASDKNVIVMGGADIGQQYIKAGLVDELSIHLVPCSSGAERRCSPTSGRRMSNSNPFKRLRPQKLSICGFASASRQRSCRINLEEE